MKHESIDKLFRDRLEQHETPTGGTEGWNKLESMLEADEEGTEKNRKRGFIWYSAAAAVVLLAIIFTYPREEGGTELAGQENTGDKVEIPAVDQQPALAENNTTSVADEPAASEVTEAIPDTKMNDYSQAVASAEEEVNKATETLPAVEDSSSPAYNNTAVVVADISEESMPEHTLPELEKQKPATENTQAVEEIQITLPDLPLAEPETLIASAEEEKRKPVTISYVNADDEPDNDRKKLSVKRLIGLAKDIKEGDINIGDLRQAKDNLIAGRYSGRSSTD
ncbi:MAG: hypothetical protein WBB45_02000 [Cyclobacteriaceae bacterium]